MNNGRGNSKNASEFYDAVYDSLRKLALTYDSMTAQTGAPPLRLHIYSETDALHPYPDGTYPETGPRLRFSACIANSI